MSTELHPNTLYSYGVRTDETRAARTLHTKQWTVRVARHGRQMVDGGTIVKILQAVGDLRIGARLIAKETGWTWEHIRRLRAGKRGDNPTVLWTKRQDFLDGMERLLDAYQEQLADLAASVEWARKKRQPGFGHQRIPSGPAYAALDYARTLARMAGPNPAVPTYSPWVRKTSTRERTTTIFSTHYDRIVDELDAVVQDRRRAMRVVVKLMAQAREGR